MKKFKLILSGLVLWLACTHLSAVDYYVTTVGVNTNDGLSWANATTLNAALAVAADDDVIHIGAGTFSPTEMITTGTLEGDKTFEIKTNVSLIGGYPVSPNPGDSPNVANITKLDGLLTSYHVIALTAPVVADKKVSIQNISITGGKAAATGTALTINTLSYVRINGGAMIIGGSVVEISNCRIYDNQSGAHTPGLYIFSGANVTINDCTIENNIGVGAAGNGASIWAASSTLHVNNCSIIGNKNSGVGAIQVITNTNAYFYNTTIAKNVAGLGNTTTSRIGSGIYVRDGSNVQVVNCTIYGNESNGNGAGIALYTSNTTTLPNTLNVINSTITANVSKLLTPSTAGIFALTAGCTVNLYNSVVSGNIALGANNYDAGVTSTSTINPKNAVIATKVFDATGGEVSGKTFIYTTMLDTLANNGGATKTCKLLLDETANPAKSLGMSSASLISTGASLTPVVPESIVAYDQLGNMRAGNVMGAWVQNGPFSEIINNTIQKPAVYAEGNIVCVRTVAKDKLVIYTISGQRVYQTTADGSLTKINNLTKGNIYIINLNGISTKFVF